MFDTEVINALGTVQLQGYAAQAISLDSHMTPYFKVSRVSVPLRAYLPAVVGRFCPS